MKFIEISGAIYNTQKIRFIHISDVLEEEGLGDNLMRLSINLSDCETSVVASVDDITEMYEEIKKELIDDERSIEHQ